MTQATEKQEQGPKGRFSLEQIRQMMLVEFDRAKRHRQPLVCMVIAVDDFSDLVRVYGEGRKGQIMQAGFAVLRNATRAVGLQGIGCWTGERLLAILPHASKAVAEKLGAALVEGAREVSFEGQGHSHSITFSVGVSRNLHDDTDTLEGLIRAAERGVAMAVEAGGDRYVHWKEVESELERIREELDATMQKMREESRRLEGEAKAEGCEEDRQLLDQLRQVFAMHAAAAPEVEAVAEPVIALVQQGLARSKQKALADQMAEHNLQIQMLERRMAKLTGNLNVTEQKLKKVASMKMVDTGIASIYGDVQGIDFDGENAESKKALMADLFQANLALKDQLQSESAESTV